MKTRMLLLSLALALAAGPALVNAQTDTKGAGITEELKALMQKVNDAWCTLDVSKAAPYYVTEGKNVIYDIAPMKYAGWKEYADGNQKIFSELSSLKLTLGQDVQTHRRGNLAWGTATWQGEMAFKTGKKENFEGRWTVIWEKRGDNWLIVHEHLSVPVAMPAPNK